MEIKVLGLGCMNCKTLEKRTMEAVMELNLDASIEKIEDIQKIASFGILSTPALIIDGSVVLKGRVPSVNELKEILQSRVVRSQK